MIPSGRVMQSGMNGNSFAGPMFCGSIALMVSADPDLLPWDLKTIITSTALDIAAKGVDDETGHGLINCYRAVKEVLRRKAVREGKDASAFEGRVAGDELDVQALKRQLVTRFTVALVQPNSPAAREGVRPGDAILSCGGVATKNMQQFRAAKAAPRRMARRPSPSSSCVVRKSERSSSSQATGEWPPDQPLPNPSFAKNLAKRDAKVRIRRDSTHLRVSLRALSLCR